MSDTSRIKMDNTTLDREGVQSEHIRQLVQERGGIKSVLTRKQRELKELLDSVLQSKEHIENKTKDLEQTFTKFHEKHKQLTTLLENEPVDLRKAAEYFNETEDNLEKIKNDVQRWLRQRYASSPVGSIKLGDSASQIGSCRSSLSSIASSRVRLQAKKAGLQVRAKELEKQQAFKIKRVELDQMEKKMKLEEEIAAITAEELIYEEYEKSMLNPDLCDTDVKTEANDKRESKLNPYAKEWVDNEGLEKTIHNKYDEINDTLNPPKETIKEQCLFTSIQQQQSILADIQKKIDSICPQSNTGGLLGELLDISPTVNKTPIIGLSDNKTLHTNRDIKEVHMSADSKHNYTNESSEERIIKLQQQMVDVMQLPKSEMVNFDGDPLRYWVFIRAFDNAVGNTSVSDSVKLNRLLQYCTGNALQVIECCSIMEVDIGYITARNLLAERFGNPYTISQAWTDRVTGGPVIKPSDKMGLRKYADDVRSCVITLDAMGRLSEVDNQIRMVKMVDRLPFYLQGRWRKTAVRMLKTNGVYPDIKMLVQFIHEAAEEVNDPVFGGDWSQKTPVSKVPNKSISNKSRSTIFTTKTYDSQSVDKREFPLCYLCSEKHAIYRCDKFREMTPEKRLEFTKENKLCFNCFSPKHVSFNCPKPYRCSFQNCAKKHSRLLHHVIYDGVTTGVKSEHKQDNSQIKGQNGHVTVCSSSGGVHGAGGRKVVLPIVPVKVRANKDQQFIHTYALLDNGSTNTFCSNELLSQLGAKGINTKLSLTTLEKVNSTSDVLLTSLELSDLNERNAVHVQYVFSTNNLPEMRDTMVTQEDIDMWPHLKDINVPVTDTNNRKVTLLIGQDVPEALMPYDVRRGKPNELYATRTMFGWTLNGPMKSTGSVNKAVSHFIQSYCNLEAQVERFWKLSTSESLADGRTQMCTNDKRVVELWDKTTKVSQDHYIIKIPFKHSPPDLPNNYTVAENRLESLGRKLSKDQGLFERYKEEIKGLVDNGFAEVIPEGQPCVKGKEWYLPHHAVLTDKKPDKLRVVFDCASKYTGTSLNEQVLQGPDLTQKLVGVLLRFRERNIGIMGDIQAMFHQVKVCPDDRDVLHFLWWNNDDITQSPDLYRMTVHLFGGVWCPSCATYALKRTAKDYGNDYDSQVVQTVNDNFYVDDCLKSVATEEQAIDLVTGLCSLLEKGGFKIVKWISNSRKVLETIPKEHRAKGVQNLDLDKDTLPFERALGVHWETETDKLGIKTILKDRPATRRGLLSVIGSIYDPIGFVCPFILKAKLIFQEETKLGKGWDDPLNPSNKERWILWTRQLPELENFEVPRCILPPDFGKVVEQELHHFSDASLIGYGAVSYLRAVNSEGQVHVSFLVGKSRLAPIKQITIPRLELSAAVISVKLDNMLRQEMSNEIDNSYFWTDSTIVLQYVKNQSKRFHTFVANRVATINDGSSPNQWRHIASENNPADDASRGLDAKRLVETETWTQGPRFLWQNQNTWQSAQLDANDLSEDDVEVKRDSKVFSTVNTGPDPIMTMITGYSSWYRLRKAVAWLLRVKQYILHRVRKQNVSFDKGNINIDELRVAEEELIKATQARHYEIERQSAHDGNPIRMTSNIYRLEPKLDSRGILCVSGRLGSDASNHQAILPKNHHLTTLIVRHRDNETSGHPGKEHVLALLRTKYWIVRGRVVVKNVIRRCVHCARRFRKPGCQRMANLPDDRTTPYKPPFTNIGIDCFGPFVVKRARSEVKRYGCIFTCLSTRAIHLEKLDTMDTQSFIDAFKRFECRRGRPEKVRTDNGSNFRGGERELREAIQGWNQDQIHEYMCQREIRWEFNPPLASHWDGVWERLICSVRKTLLSLLRVGQILTDESLSTLFCEVENIVNSRPITAVSDDPKDLNPLTPNHILLLRSGPTLPLTKFTKEDALRHRWKQVQFMADQFWRRWLREYLPTLQLRQKWIAPQRNFCEGDIVLLTDSNAPMLNWPLGRVLKVFPGKDGLVRCVEVKTRWNIFTRPVDKLCLLESSDGM